MPRRQPFQPITDCQHFRGGQALTTRANGEERRACVSAAGIWRPAARCSFAGPLLTIGQVPRQLASGLWRMLSGGAEDDRR